MMIKYLVRSIFICAEPLQAELPTPDYLIFPQGYALPYTYLCAQLTKKVDLSLLNIWPDVSMTLFQIIDVRSH